MFAEENIISERCTDIYKNNLLSEVDKIVTENFSRNYLNHSVENNMLPGTSEYNSSDRTRQCTKCNTRNRCICKTQNTLTKDTKPKCHTCDVCNKSFPYLSKLARHKMIHEDVKNFSCTVCSKSFRHSSSLLKHKLIHSGKKKISIWSTLLRYYYKLSQHKLF